MTVLSMLLTVGVSTMTALPASAAPGDPFNSAAPIVFIAQGVPTVLSQATTNGAGTTTFTPVGPPANFQYNSIGYNPADNYIYAITRSAGNATDGSVVPQNSLIRIGQGGVITVVGTMQFGVNNVGAFGADGNLYAMFGNSNNFMTVINPSTGLQVRTVNLSAVPEVSDFAYQSGYFWGIRNNNGQLVRINPVTGQVNFFAAVVPGATGYGAAWTYGNGNLGFSNNDTGTIYQIQVTNPSAQTPTFTVVSANPGPPNGNNDGTSSPGIPTDLSIAKAAPATFTAGDTVSYTLRVTNNGAGTSSGFVVSDAVPAPLTAVASSTSGCTVSGNQVRCVSGTLAVGGSQAFTITAATPATITSCVTNMATVLADETDPNRLNDSSSVTSCPSATISVAKQVASRLDAADQFTVALKDSSGTSLTSTTTTGASTSSTSSPAMVTRGETYTLTEALAAGSDLSNYTKSAVCTGANSGTSQTLQGAGPDWTFAPSTLDAYTCTVTNTAKSATLGITTHAAPAVDANGDGLTDAGDQIAYSFTVSNTGNVTLTGVQVVEGAFTGSGHLSAVSCPSQSTTLAPGAQAECTARYAATQADLDQGSIANTATATGTPPSGPAVTSAPSTLTVLSDARGALNVTKRAHAVDTNSNHVIDRGDRIDWSLEVANTGTATVRDIAISDPSAGQVTCAGTALQPGTSMTCTVPSHIVTDADRAAGSVRNTASATGTDSHGVISSNAATATVTLDPQTATVTPAPQTGAAPTLLARTGVGQDTLFAAVGGALALLLGLILMLAARRRPTPASRLRS